MTFKNFQSQFQIQKIVFVCDLTEIPQWQCSRCWKKYTSDQFHQLFSCWADPKDKRYGKVAVCTCGAIFHKDRWQLASFVEDYRVCTCGAIFHKDRWQLASFVEDYRVSTVHLNLGHYDNMDFLNEDMRYFETMINNIKTTKWLSFQARYKTMSDAIEGHWLAVDNLSNIILNPDKYPKDILGRFCDTISAEQDQQKVKFRKDNR